MKTRKLVDIECSEISLVFLPHSPVVTAARPLIIKGALPYLETEEAKAILRQCAAIVDKLKLDAKERELAAALAKEQAARRTPKRYRVYDSYESYESSAAQARRMNARQEFYAECKELAEHNRNKQSDLFK